jgi:tryptophanyl-tRNA synthetase
MATFLSGIKPTGLPHIGNYFGAIRQFVGLQAKYEQPFVFVADLHALNFVQDAEQMRSNIYDLVACYLAAGLDPAKTILFKQSDVPAHTEMCWIFDTITSVPYLQRAHAMKDAEAKGKEVSMGTFNYPMLMAGDILLYQPDIVPVGSDQKQHVEYARDTAEKFNRVFKSEVFKLPKELILEDVATVPGLDGRKMSKSYGNVIGLFDTAAEIEKKVMSIATDSKGPTEPKDPDESVLFAINRLVLDADDQDALAQEYRDGISYKDAKRRLIDDLEAFIKPIREKYNELRADEAGIRKILADGAIRANEVAQKTLAAARQAVGIAL